jgi:hypothetical protein
MLLKFHIYYYGLLGVRKNGRGQCDHRRCQAGVLRRARTGIDRRSGFRTSRIC